MARASTTAGKTRSAHRRRIEILREHFAELRATGIPKHVRLRNAVLGAIRDGSLKPGDQIPPEQEFSGALGISLGTVQRALGRLALEGTLSREHGRGTFVAQPKQPVDEVWQFRFHDPDMGGLLPVYSKVVGQSLVHAGGPWSDAVGPDAKGYLRIARLFNVGDKFPCYSHFFVGMSRFGALRRMADDELESINLKRILADQFNAPTLAVTERVQAARFPETVCDFLSAKRGTTGLVVEAVGHSYGHEPISFQKIWVAPSDYFLDMTPVDAATPVPANKGRASTG